MSDQQAPQNGDTPAVAGPTEAPGTQEQQQAAADPYEKRYNDLRPEFDRATQERAELAQWKEWAELALTTNDADTQRQALERLGFPVPEDDFEDEEPAEWTDGEDPVADLRAQIAEERQWRQNLEQAAAEAAAEEFLNDHVQGEFQRLGIDKLPDGVKDHIKRLIPSAPGIPAPPGSPHHELPNVEAIWNYFQQFRTEDQKQWARVKQNAPYVPSGGLPANEVPDPGTGHNSRMNRAMRALQEQQE